MATTVGKITLTAKKELLRWALILVVFILFLWSFSYVIMDMSYQIHTDQIRDHARDTLLQLQYVIPRLDPHSRQDYIESVYPKSQAFRYILVMDKLGNAFVHSDRERIGMNFYDPGFQQALDTGATVEQIYVRDANNQESPFHGEKTVDMIAPFYSRDGILDGVVNVGLSLKALDTLRQRYLLVTFACATVWFAMMSSYAILRYRNYSSRLEAERQRENLQALLDNIINSMPSSLIAVDSRLMVVQWNIGAEQVTGVSANDALNRYLPDVYPALSKEIGNITAAVLDREPYVHSKARRVDGDNEKFENIVIYPLDSSGIDGAVIRIDDVTDRIRMEEMMIQTEKMMSLGGLAAGMAHEINNPLAGILQNIQVVIRRISEDSSVNIIAARKAGCDFEAIKCFMEIRDVLSLLEAVRSSGVKAAHIVSEMLEFSRKSTKNFVPTDINALLDKTIDLCSSNYDLKKKYDFRRISFTKIFDNNLPLVYCKDTQVQQVFMNLLANASQAMAEIASPEIILRTTLENNIVSVEIEDNGPGISEGILDHIFEPFFTTKPVGEGTGLGLSISYFIIVNHHNGFINVESTLGKGTRFIIKIPVKPPSEHAMPAVAT